jgi:hypothetical protein
VSARKPARDRVDVVLDPPDVRPESRSDDKQAHAPTILRRKRQPDAPAQASGERRCHATRILVPTNVRAETGAEMEQEPVR